MNDDNDTQQAPDAENDETDGGLADRVELGEGYGYTFVEATETLVLHHAHAGFENTRCLTGDDAVAQFEGLDQASIDEARETVASFFS